jgi:signal transduction histidine kinase
MIMIAMITGYHIVLHGEAEVVELALLYVVVSSMVLFPWGGRGQAIVASAGVAAFVVALASGLELRTPVGLHLLGLGTAVLLTVGGAIFLEQYRFSVFRQAEELRRVNEAKTQLLANVSHELRTPLNVVIGYQQLLTEGAFGDLPPAAQDTMSRVMAYSRMLLTLIDDFLDLSRLEKQRLTLRMEPIELRGLCAEVGALIEPLLRDKQVQFRCYINNGEVAYADRDRLRQVLLNLLTNAIKFTDRGSIELRSHRPEQQRLVIEVEDTGVGIAAAEQEAIFQPFRRGAQSMHVRGVGIGLALSRQLTEAMGGRLSVSSTPGHGSTFSIQLAAS